MAGTVRQHGRESRESKEEPAPKSGMSVQEAGHHGGQRVRELVEEGKHAEGETGKSTKGTGQKKS